MADVFQRFSEKISKFASMNELIFTPKERDEAMAIARKLKNSVGTPLDSTDEEKVFKHLKRALRCDTVNRNPFGLNPILLALQTAQIAVEEIGLRRDGVLAILLYAIVGDDDSSYEEIRQDFGESVARIIAAIRNVPSTRPTASAITPQSESSVIPSTMEAAERPEPIGRKRMSRSIRLKPKTASANRTIMPISKKTKKALPPVARTLP